MTWQNQPGQQLSGQPAQPFPGQPVPPFAGQNVQSFPGQPNLPLQGHPGMAFLQQPQIPPEVIAAAQAAGLGIPTREYRKGASGRNLVTSNVQSTLSFTLIGVGVTMLIVLGVVLFVVPFPFNLITAGIIVVTTLPFLPMLLRLRNSAGGGKKTFVAWSCPEGLVYSQNNQISLVRWSEIKQIWRKIGMLNGMLTTLAYIVEPDNAPPFSFSILNGPFADMILGNNTGGSMSISFGGGEISNNGGFVQISGNFSLTEYPGLGDLIEEQVIQRLLPRITEAYREGGTVGFGSFVLRRQGMGDGMREIAWTDVDRIQISGAAVQITKKPASTVWFNLSAAALPNFALLCAFLNTIRSDRV
jgi:hypothetical protein